MSGNRSYDAIVVGSGPNGLAAAITVARAGHSVLVLEANETIGGGARSEELTLPGFVHDTCSAIHPLAAGSPFFSTLPLSEHGLEWIYPSASVAHPLDDGTAIVLERSVEATGEALGVDSNAYQRLMAPFVADWDKLAKNLLGPFSDGQRRKRSSVRESCRGSFFHEGTRNVTKHICCQRCK